MEYQNITDNTASKYLGKKAEGSSTYDPSLLVAIPRFENRIRYGIDNSNLPFFGWDVWHSYEFSVLTENSVPVTRVLKLRYNCNSEFLVESKSLKLYLNSYNMTKFGSNIEQCLELCKVSIERDLSDKLKTDVEVNFLDNKTERSDIFSGFKNLTSLVDINNIKISKFKESPELLNVISTDEVNEHYLMFDSLRSNCRVTHQPDFGDAFIYYRSRKRFDEASLFKYLVSFRSEYHFHEECCEMIYKRLYDLLDADDELFVCALYTRRGGIDISPVRMSKNCTFNSESDKLISLNKFARYGMKQ